MKQKNGRLLFLIAICAISFMMSRCDEDLPDDPDENGGNVNVPADWSPDELGELLALENPVRLSGEMPFAPEGDLLIDHDTIIYVVEGFSHGARMLVKHDGTKQIAGFYVGVEGASFHYDVESIPELEQDSMGGLFVHIKFPDNGESKVLTSGVPIIIQPHGPDGMPLDEFRRTVVVEKPKGSEALTNGRVGRASATSRALDECNLNFTEGDGEEEGATWEWEFTVGINYQGEVYQVTGPRYHPSKGGDIGGCCIAGTWVSHGQPGGIDGDCNELHPDYMKVEIASLFSVAAYDYLMFKQGDLFRHSSASVTRILDYTHSDFCNYNPLYIYDMTTYTKTGIHSWNEWEDKIDFEIVTANPPFGPGVFDGDVLYTCNRLIISSGREEIFRKVYKRVPAVAEWEAIEEFEAKKRWWSL